MPARPARTRATVLLAAATALAGCSAADPPPAGGTAPAAAPATGSADVLDGVGHVHTVALDPSGDGLLLATHTGLVRVDADGRAQAVGPVVDLMGFTVAEPGRFLASGHPGPSVDLPEPVGLIESTDGGETWQPLSRQGESDFHALTAGADGVLGFDGRLLRSSDGESWEELDVPAPPVALAAAPDGRRVLAATAAGPLRSDDGGRTWGPLAGAPLLQALDWVGDGTTVVGVEPDGQVWLFDGAWREGADLGAAPVALDGGAATEPGRMAVVTEAGVAESRDGGVTFTTVLPG